MAELLSLHVPCNAEAPRVVRHAIQEIEEIQTVRDEFQLVASELVTNAVRHSGCAGDESIGVHVSSDDAGGRLVLRVEDPGTSGVDAVVRDRSSAAYGGWGLALVAALAERWGVERDGVQRVWASFSIAA